MFILERNRQYPNTLYDYLEDSGNSAQSVCLLSLHHPHFFNKQFLIRVNSSDKAVTSVEVANPFWCTAHNDVAVFQDHKALYLFEHSFGFVDHEVVVGELDEFVVDVECHTQGL